MNRRGITYVLLAHYIDFFSRLGKRDRLGLMKADT